MNQKILKIAYLVFMLLVLATLVVFLVVQLRGGVDTGTEKLFTSLYFLMIAWALFRIFTLVKDLTRKKD